jgi:signal transduction histidine kinase
VRFFQLNGEPRGPGPTLPPWDPAVISRAALGFEVFSTAATEEGIFRVYSFPVGPPGPPEAVAQTAVPLNEQHRLLTSLARTLLLLIPLALAAAGVGGAFLASRAIAPVQALKRATLELGEGDLSRRIEVSGRDEFADLAVTFNAMAARLSSAFSRLESAYEQQRRFAGDASHELRTPLTTLKANTSLALSLKPDLDAYREALEAADAAADVMNRIVQDLLLLARSDDGRLQMDLQLLDIDTVLRDAARATSRPELAPVLVQTRTEGALVAGDPLHLRRLFTNLLENALRHTPAAGTVRLAARALDQPVPTGGAASTALACPAPAVGTVPPVPASTPEPASSGISIEVRPSTYRICSSGSTGAMLRVPIPVTTPAAARDWGCPSAKPSSWHTAARSTWTAS